MTKYITTLAVTTPLALYLVGKITLLLTVIGPVR